MDFLSASEGRRSALLKLMTLFGGGLLSALFPRNLLADVAPTWLSAGGRSLHGLEAPVGLAGSFYRNVRTNVVHYIDKFSGASTEALRQRHNLIPISERQLISLLTNAGGSDPAGARLSLRQAGVIAERLALRQLRRGNTASALELLWAGILHDTAWKRASGGRPSYRLYDLYAGIARRAENDSALRAVRKHVRTVWPNDRLLGDRTRNWLDRPSAWQARWRSEEFNWRFPEARA